MRGCCLRNWILAAGMFAATLSGRGVQAAENVVPSGSEVPVAAPKPRSGGESVVLKYHFEPNQAVHYKVTQKMAINSQKGTARQIARSEWTTYKHMRVVSVDANGVAALETTIDRILATLQFDADEPHSYDSNSDDDPPGPLEKTCKTIGKPLARMQFTPAGHLLNTEFLPIDDLDETPGTAAKANDSSNSKSFLIVLPETPVKVGDSWKDPLTVNVSIPPNLETSITLGRTYTLQSVENGVATIRLETSILTPVNNQAVMAQLISLTPAGTIQFDMQKGLITGKTFSSDETVYEFAGPGSKMRAENVLVEAVVEPAAVASKPASEVGPPAPR